MRIKAFPEKSEEEEIAAGFSERSTLLYPLTPILDEPLQRSIVGPLDLGREEAGWKLSAAPVVSNALAAVLSQGSHVHGQFFRFSSCLQILGAMTSRLPDIRWAKVGHVPEIAFPGGGLGRRLDPETRLGQPAAARSVKHSKPDEALGALVPVVERSSPYRDGGRYGRSSLRREG